MSSENVQLSAIDVLMEQVVKSKSFARIGKANLKTMMKRIEMIPVGAGETIFRQGESGDSFYIIGSGKCRVFNYPSNGGAIIEIATLGPGDTFGEDSLIRGTPRGASIEMLTDGTLARLNKEEFETLIKKPLLRGVAIAEAKNMVAYEASMIDTRSAAEFAKCAAPGSRNVPLNQLRDERRRFDKNLTYITVSDRELESALAAFLLAQKGLDARYLTAPVAEYIRACANDDADTLARLGGSEIDSIIELPAEYMQGDGKVVVPDRTGRIKGAIAQVAPQPQAETSDPVGQLRAELIRALAEQETRHRAEMHTLRVKVRALLEQYQNKILELERKLAALPQTKSSAAPCSARK